MPQHPPTALEPSASPASQPKVATRPGGAGGGAAAQQQRSTLRTGVERRGSQSEDGGGDGLEVTMPSAAGGAGRGRQQVLTLKQQLKDAEMEANKQSVMQVGPCLHLDHTLITRVYPHPSPSGSYVSCLLSWVLHKLMLYTEPKLRMIPYTLVGA